MSHGCVNSRKTHQLLEFQRFVWTSKMYYFQDFETLLGSFLTTKFQPEGKIEFNQFQKSTFRTQRALKLGCSR